jgi:hypothetical protein
MKSIVSLWNGYGEGTLGTYSELISEATPLSLTFYESAFTEKGGQPKGAKQHATVESFEALAEWARRAPLHRKDKRRAPTFTRGLNEGARNKSNTAPPFLVILDFDKVTKSLSWVSDRLTLHGVDLIGYTTHSNGKLDALGLSSFRVFTDHVATTWGELRDIVDQLSDMMPEGCKPAKESWDGLTWFAPVVHPKRAEFYEYVESLTGGSSWFPDRRNATDYDKPRPKRERVPVENLDLAEVESALGAIPNGDLHYDDWLEIGFALHDTGSDEAFDLWKDWSAKSIKHDPEYCEVKWETMHEGRGDAVTLGTVFHHAKANGWEAFADPTPTAAQDFENYTRKGFREPETANSVGDEEGENDEADRAKKAVASLTRWKSCLDGVNRRQALKLMNDRFAFVLEVGAILDTQAQKGSAIFHKPLTFRDFFIHPMFEHPTKRDRDGNAIMESIGKLWFNWENRRVFEAIDFLPPGGHEYLHPDTFNRWRGWAFEPEEGDGHRLFLEHVFENVAGGNEEWGKWVVAWMAHLIQKPYQKPGTALVLRSDGEGTGKGVFFNTVRELCGEQGIRISNSERLTGRFNAHLFGKLFVFADEVTWGGNRKEAGILRGLVTDSPLDYEEKNVPAWSAGSYSRLGIAGNDRWLVPAATTSRRWQVFDVSTRRQQDRPYFLRLIRALRGGGYANLLHYLAGLDLNDYPDPCVTVSTQALVDQKVESLDSVDRWLYSTLENGHFSTSNEWPTGPFAKRTIYDCYLAHAQEEGQSRRAVETRVGKRLKEVFGSTLRLGRIASGDERIRGYQFPPLDVARKHFENNVIQGEVEWPEDLDVDEEGAP